MSVALRARVRNRSIAAHFAAAALVNTAMATAGPAGMIVAAERLGVAWSAVPAMAMVIGSGIGALLVTRLTARRGWRTALTAAYATGALGAAAAIPATAAGGSSLRAAGLLAPGLLLLGVSNAGAQLTRYAAADLFPAQVRGRVIGALVAVGAVGGPLLLAPVCRAAAAVGLAAYTGPLLLATFATLVAVVAARTLPGGRTRHAAEPVPLRALLTTSMGRAALGAMVAGQLVMVLMMTAVPVSLHLQHRSLTMIGVALSAHTLGMFAPAPLTGLLADRFGARPVLTAGLLTLAGAAVTAAAVPDVGYRHAVHVLALFALGFGWNLCFVAGSASLAATLPAAYRTRVEGAVDAAVWGAAATMSLTSTLLLSTGGLPVLGLLAGVLALLPLLGLLRG